MYALLPVLNGFGRSPEHRAILIVTALVQNNIRKRLLDVKTSLVLHTRGTTDSAPGLLFGSFCSPLSSGIHPLSVRICEILQRYFSAHFLIAYISIKDKPYLLRLIANNY